METVPEHFIVYPNPPDSVFSRFVRLFLPLLSAALLVACGKTSTVYAQLDARTPQNRIARDARNAPQPSQAAVMMKEMQTALQNLPWDDFSPAFQTKIKSVTTGAPLFHRMQQQTVYADPEIYNFLLQHPELVIGFWEQMGATQLSLREIKENIYILHETAGTVARVEILYRTNDLCVIYAKGDYRGPLLSKGYQGEVILILRTQYKRDETNEPMIICDLDSFVRINNLGADVLAKMFFTSLTKIADSNFEVTVSFTGQVSRAASRNNAALKATAEEITSIRQEVCAEFCEVADRVAMRYARRNQPMPLVSAPQQKPHVVQSKADEMDFRVFTKPPAEWGMDHLSDTPLPSFRTVHFENGGQFTVPQSLGVNANGFTPPELPEPGK